MAELEIGLERSRMARKDPQRPYMRIGGAIRSTAQDLDLRHLLALSQNRNLVDGLPCDFFLVKGKGIAEAEALKSEFMTEQMGYTYFPPFKKFLISGIACM